MFVTNCISTTKIQKISEITNFFRHYFLSRTEVIHTFFCFYAAVFIKLKLRPDVACTTSGRIFCCVGT